MREVFQDVVGWTFVIEEVSANVYAVIGTDSVGHRVEMKGTDPKELLEEAKRSARRIRESAGEAR